MCVCNNKHRRWYHYDDILSSPKASELWAGEGYAGPKGSAVDAGDVQLMAWCLDPWRDGKKSVTQLLINPTPLILNTPQIKLTELCWNSLLNHGFQGGV